MKNKILIFVAGLFAGLTIGVLFSVAIKALISQVKEVHISLNKINLQQNQLSQRLDSIQGKLLPETKKQDNKTTSQSPKSVASATSRASEANENNGSQDSNSTDELANADVDDSDIIVMTNQLVSVLSVKVKTDDTARENKKTAKIDSTIAAMSNVNNKTDNEDYRIEFWKSPLNYKGYKMSTGKIILYGISPVTPVSLVSLQGNYYILVNQSAYKIDFTDDYKPFERVTDKMLLKKWGYDN